MTPVMLMTLSTTPWAAFTVSTTIPPSVVIRPLFDTSESSGAPSGPNACCTTLASATRLISPSPNRSTVNALPEASVTRPRLATITPWLATPGATSATSPPSATVMVPWLTTEAVESLDPKKLNCPSTKPS